MGLRRRLSPRTIGCYRRWAVDFLRYRGDRGAAAGAADPDGPFDLPSVADGAAGGRRVWRHPRALSAVDVGDSLTHLARDRELSVSSQN